MNPNRGGVQRVSDTLAKYFKRRGYNIYYLTFEYDNNDEYDFPAKLIQLPDSNFYSEANIHFYQNLLKELSIDIIINHDAANDRSKLFLNIGNSSTKCISIYHTDPLHELQRKPNLGGRIKYDFIRKLVVNCFSGFIHVLRVVRKKRQIKGLLNKSDRLIVLSDQHKIAIEKKLGVISNRIVAIHNPIAKLDVDTKADKKKHVLFVARMELAVKRPDQMLQIWAGISQQYPDWELVLLGDGPDMDKLIRMAKLLNLQNIRFEGFVLPASYYSKASILCMTSDYEGFPSVLLEAMEKGVVPITFNNWVTLKDVIENGVNGILVERDNINEFSIRLKQLIDDVELRQKLLLAAKESVVKFQITTIGPQWDKLFEELI